MRRRWGSEVRSCRGAEAARDNRAGDFAESAGGAAGRGDVGFGREERAGGAGCASCAHGRTHHAHRRPSPLRAPRALHRCAAARARRADRLARGSIHRGLWCVRERWSCARCPLPTWLVYLYG
ncbi:unnamed protein product, partial [Closterium sp. Naga37s-1]